MTSSHRMNYEEYGNKSTTAHTSELVPKDEDYLELEAGLLPKNYNSAAAVIGKVPATGPAADIEKQLRLGFIRKVYGILSIQILVTVVVASVCVFSTTVRTAILSNPGVMPLGFFFSLGLLLGLMCYRTEYPINMYLLGSWTLVEAYMVGVICASYASQEQGEIVIQAAGLTLVVFLGLTLFTFQTKKDFSFLNGAIFAGLIVLVLWGLMMAIFGYRQSFVYSLCGAFLFSLYILYDTSRLMHHLSYDEYIVASISLYLDIINLFLHILRILSALNRRR